MKKLLLILSVLIFSFANATPSDTVFVNVGNYTKAALINVIDQKTGATVSADVSNIVIQNTAPQFATVTISPANSRAIVITPVTSGSGSATVSCHLTYTDLGNGMTQSEDKQIVIVYTVTYTPPNGVKLSLTFN